MGRRPRAKSISASVTWRDGIHITGTPIWCDARRRRDVCFVSSADRVGRSGHGQLIATPLTLALLGGAEPGDLVVPLHRRFTLGTLRLELITSGRGPGAAGLLVDNAGHVVLYGGVIRTAGAGNAPIEVAEVRACNTAVVVAPYAPDIALPPLAETVARALEWARAQLASDRRPVLIVDGLVDALEVAGCLRAAGIPIAAPRTIRDAARRASTAGAPLAALAPTAGPANVNGKGRAKPDGVHGKPPPAIAAPGREPRAVIWLAGDRAGLAKALGDHPRATARISVHPDDGTDVAFAWSTASTHAQLLAWLEQSGARDVFITGAGADAIARALGPNARVIGPPEQMTLFPGAPP